MKEVFQSIKDYSAALSITSIWAILSLPLAIVLLFAAQSLLTGGRDYCSLQHVVDPLGALVLSDFRSSNVADANRFLDISAALMLMATVGVFAYSLAKTRRGQRALIVSLSLFPLLIFTLLWIYNFHSGQFCQY